MHSNNNSHNNDTHYVQITNTTILFLLCFLVCLFSYGGCLLKGDVSIIIISLLAHKVSNIKLILILLFCCLFFLSPMIIIYFISISPHGFATSFFGMFNHFIVFSSDILIANRLRRDIYYFIW